MTKMKDTRRGNDLSPLIAQQLLRHSGWPKPACQKHLTDDFAVGRCQGTLGFQFVP